MNITEIENYIYPEVYPLQPSASGKQIPREYIDITKQVIQSLETVSSNVTYKLYITALGGIDIEGRISKPLSFPINFLISVEYNKDYYEELYSHLENYTQVLETLPYNSYFDGTQIIVDCIFYSTKCSTVVAKKFTDFNWILFGNYLYIVMKTFQT